MIPNKKYFGPSPWPISPENKKKNLWTKKNKIKNKKIYQHNQSQIQYSQYFQE